MKYVILLLALVLVSGCTQIQLPPTPTTITISIPPQCNRIQEAIDNCRARIAQTKNDIMFCEKIQNEIIKSSCFSEMGKKTKDISICNRATSDIDNGFCVRKIALEENNSAPCYYAREGTFRDGCLLALAYQTLNITLCENVSQNQKDTCYQSLAITLKNSTLCDKLTFNNFSKVYCHDQAILAKAYPSECASVIEEYEKDHCYWSAAIVYDNLEVCRIINNSYQRNSCIATLAVKRKDLSLCENVESLQIGGNLLKNGCFRGIAEELKDPSLCGKIEDFSDKNYCFYRLAEITKNPDLCSRISLPSLPPPFGISDKTEENEKKDCKSNAYTKQAIETQDPSFCESIEDIGGQVGCLISLGKGLTLTHCTLLQGDPYKAGPLCARCGAPCYFSVARSQKDFSICEKADQSGSSHPSNLASCYNFATNAVNDTTACESLLSLCG